MNIAERNLVLMQALTLSIPSEQWRVQATLNMGHLQLLESIGHVQAECNLALMRALTLAFRQSNGK